MREINRSKLTSVASVATPGYSLIELLVVISILAVAISATVPTLETIHKDATLESEADRFLYALLLAKKTAESKTKNVVLCTSNTTNDACDPTKSWQDGWIVYLDSSPAEVILVDGLSNDITMTASNFITPSTSKRIEFNKEGEIAGANIEAELLFCDDRGDKKAMVLLVNNSGLAFFGTDSNDADEISEGFDGTNVSC